MEGTRYWMWSRRNFLGPSKDQSASSYHPSWEEQAFAEDSSGLLGGCIWPPRSYTCTFCRREFRSAQALGGHMNVHRRDRARLRKSPSPQSEENQNHHRLLDLHQYPSEVRSLVYPNHNPNSTANPNPCLAPSPKVSVQTSSCFDNKCNEQPLTLVSNQKLSFSPPEAKTSSAFTIQILSTPDDAKFKEDVNCDVSNQEPFDGSKEPVPRRTKFGLVALDSDDEGNTVDTKRARICNGGTLPLFFRHTAPPDHLLLSHRHLHSDLRDRTRTVIEELDLELRLGQRPQLK